MIESKCLTEYINQKLNLPLDHDLNKEDLSKITEISINGKDLQGNLNDYDFKDFLKMENLQFLNLQNFIIDNYQTNIINRIKTLKTLQFTDCKFKSKSTLFNNIELISFTSCTKVNSKYFENLKNLKTLKINLCGKAKINSLDKLQGLKTIDIIDTKTK